MTTRKQLRVMKFGGTSVGDAKCIRSVVEIITEAARQGPVVAVVSAMSGVTDFLIRAAHRSATGQTSVADELGTALRQLHLAALDSLVSDPFSYSRLAGEMEDLINETFLLCLKTARTRKLTPRMLDTIASVGERLSTRLIAGALCASGQPGVVVEATQLIITNALHTAAEPLMQQTRERARARLLPMLDDGAIPVVTGFIGATTRSVLTTLGRGGSDYSASILGAVLDAKEIILWTDVDGILTADPRLISEARTQSCLSYGEATDLASFGAKGLHPKTLHPVMEAGIPVHIRNSFAAESSGTTITCRGDERDVCVKALTVLGEVCLIAVNGFRIKGSQDVITKAVSLISDLPASLLPLLTFSPEYKFCFITSKTASRHVVKALRYALALPMEHIIVKWNVAVVTAVGDGIRNLPGIRERLCGALESEGIQIITIGHGVSENNTSVVIEAAEIRRGLAALHREFKLEQPALAPHLSLTVAAELG
jgi:bifunctional aspartokinase / homoserine dehydrogenase 1